MIKNLKYFSFLFIIGILLFLTSCSAGTAQIRNNEVETDETIKTENSLTGGDIDSNVLVAYYSATGTTKKIAEMIVNYENAASFEIEPKHPYSDTDLDWSNPNSRVSFEHDNKDQRDIELVKVTPENWNNYDTVYIGYPIWWGEAAWPVDTFVTENDFSGKTVIPFCTSDSSGIGQSGELLNKLAGTGDWLGGIRFSSSSTSEDVANWIENCNN